MKKVLVVMGSDSDLKVMEKCVDRLKSFDIPTEVRICSAHRTPAAAEQLAKNAAAEGFGVIIAAAGKAAHLGGVLAAYTTLPVIGVPMATSVMGGMDSLLSIVQMPKGIPVARVLSVAPSDYTQFMAIYAEPLVDLQHLEEVLLLEPTGIAQPEPEGPPPVFVGPPAPPAAVTP